MDALDLITKKRDGGRLSEAELSFLMKAYTTGQIPDFQMSALLMVVFFRGMETEETLALVRAMIRSGEVLDLQDLPNARVDMHSTGGVGDKTPLVVAPLAAAAGLYVPMISGRSLRFSGGTLDKLESIPGFNVHLTLKAIASIVRNTGCVLVGETAEIIPADDKLYVLRNLTATMECIPLLCVSIMSKKLAEGLVGLVLDVKVGYGSSTQTMEQASDLAQTLVDIGNNMGTRTVAMITDMSQPLGATVGNALEVKEVIETLKCRGPADLENLCLKLTARMLLLGGTARTPSEAKEKVRHLLDSGAGLEKLRQVIEAQGGDPKVIDDTSRLPSAVYCEQILSSQQGYVTRVEARSIGAAAMALGAGRETMESVIDPAVGLVLHKKVGDRVKTGEPLCTVHYNNKSKFHVVKKSLYHAFLIGPDHIEPPGLIKRVIE